MLPLQPGGEFITTPPVPAERHAKLYPDVVLPRVSLLLMRLACMPDFSHYRLVHLVDVACTCKSHPHALRPIPAPIDSSSFAAYIIKPQSTRYQQYADFNETDAGKPAFLRALPPLTLANSTFMDHYYRQRLRSLKAVDELVESLVTGAA